MIKLNLGCGTKQYHDEGWVNIDARQIDGVDVVHDLSTSLPYADNSIDYIIAEDVLEHMTYRITDKVFADWCRVLKPGGMLKIVVPNIDAHIQLYLTHGVDRGVTVDIDRLRHMIFGCQDHPYNYHYTTFDQISVENLYVSHGMQMPTIVKTRKGIIAEGVKSCGQS